MTQETMYPLIIGDYKTTLTAPFQAGIDTTVYVADASFLPPGENTCTIRIPNQTYLVTIKYAGKTSTSLVGVSIVQGTPASALTSTFAVGSEVSKPIAQTDIQAIQNNIRDLAAGGGGGGTDYVKRREGTFEMGMDANGTYIWD